MTSTAHRVREVIKASGLSQRAFAAEIGLDDSKLSKSLGGVRRFTSLDLARIAKAGDVTVDWLITGDATPLAMAARSTGGSAQIAIREANRLSQIRSDIAFLGFDQPWRPVMVDSPRAAAYKHGAFLGNLARNAVDDSGWEDWDDLPALVETVFGADVTVVALDNDFDGLAVSSADVKLILVATSQQPWRQRFTMAHELGHLLAADDQRLYVDADVLDPAKKKDLTEVRANAFAAHFLMPEAALREAVGTFGLTPEAFSALVCDLGVSPSALAYRLLNLRLIDAGRCDQFRKLSGGQAAHLAGRGSAFGAGVNQANTPRPPGLLLRDTYAAYDSGSATLRPYANVTGSDVDALREALESGSEVVGAP